MASPPVLTAEASWGDAMRLRKHISTLCEELHKLSVAGQDTSAGFEKLDKYMNLFRLACVRTIFLDFEYAVKTNTEDVMWMVHVSINTEYRRVLGRMKGQSSASVERRKLDHMYSDFLRIASKFYKAYIQRLSARYDIEELRRAASGIHVERLPTENTISPVPQALQDKVTESCHLTLIRLGDLTRYKIKSSHSRSTQSYQAALAFYGLARQLKPGSGFALHQMGIVHLDQGDHFEVVCYFYRAWTVEKPHPMAQANLESAFKTLPQRISGGKRSREAKDSTTVTRDAFILWFVRLHALFYKGEESQSKQEELEKEVVHRLEMTARNPKLVPILLKTALVNMAALHVAALKYRESPSDAAASRFYSNSMRFNVRFILTLCGVMESQLKDKSDHKDVIDAREPSQTTDLVGELLPVLRTYCLWLATNGREVFGAIAVFGPLIPKMVQALARVFTLLCVETDSQKELKTAPYLLPEDVEVRGFEPLKEILVPEACRFFYGQDRKYKPHPPTKKQRLSAVEERAARILDTLRCAYFFTEDEITPLVYQIKGNALVFEYGPVARSSQIQTSVTPAPTSTPPNEKPAGPSPDGARGQQDEAASRPASPMSADLLQDARDALSRIMSTGQGNGKEKDQGQGNDEGKCNGKGRGRGGGRGRGNGNGKGNGKGKAKAKDNDNDQGIANGNGSDNDIVNGNDIDNLNGNGSDPRGGNAYEDANEQPSDTEYTNETVMNMLSPFLKPPTPMAQQQNPRPRSTGLHGLHAIFENSACVDQPTPSKPIVSLPWGWFDAHVPEEAQDPVSSASKEAFNGQRRTTQSPALSASARTFQGKPLTDDSLAVDPWASPRDRLRCGAIARKIFRVGSPVDHMEELRLHQEKLWQACKAAIAEPLWLRLPSSSNPWLQQEPAARGQNLLLTSAWTPPETIEGPPKTIERPPLTSSTSRFSNASNLYHAMSLYDATPPYLANYGVSAPYEGGRSVSQEAVDREASQPLRGREFQIDRTTSNYDAAILQSAYHNPG